MIDSNRTVSHYISGMSFKKDILRTLFECSQLQGDLGVRSPRDVEIVKHIFLIIRFRLLNKTFIRA
jgi:hypothetical protein